MRLTRKWYQLEGHDTGPTLGPILSRLNAIDGRLAEFDKRLALLERGELGDQAQFYHRDEYHGDVAGVAQTLVPYLSTTSRFVESLTSPKMVKTMAGEALILGLSFAGMGLAVQWGWDIPVKSVPALGLGGFALSGALLVLINRTELHRLISAQDRAGQRSRRELHIQVDRPDPDGHLRNVQFLLVSGVTPEQLGEWAGRVLDGASLAVKNWSGQGALFSEGQYTALMSELERAGYVLAGRGNVARSLHPRSGPALLRQCAKLGKPE